MPDDPVAITLDEAREVIAAQALELERLRALERELAPLTTFRESLEAAAIANRLAANTTQNLLYHLIVETAASVLDAETASLFLVDSETQELVFEVALGQPDAEEGRWRLEPGTGIVGLVAATGQPMAMTNVSEDPRHAAAIAERMGRHPRSLLCVPLFLEGEVVGVLELLDKRGADGFTPSDMASMGLFANQAAVAIMQSRAQKGLESFLRGVAPGTPEAHAGALAELLESAPEVHRALELASRVRALAAMGPREQRLADAVLDALAQYAGKR